ncbi:MAG: hypothetical protein IPO09_02000 [Anaeromyxobacter sp.]|nr:hypothetical protein [Anaeromyxobacter sp.]MBL0278068.1 hypothetical protein [Anaeromyxobacter sp.]
MLWSLAAATLFFGGCFWLVWRLTGEAVDAPALERPGRPARPPTAAPAEVAREVVEPVTIAPGGPTVPPPPPDAAPKPVPSPPAPLPAAPPATPELRARASLQALVEPCRALGRRPRSRPTVLAVVLQPEADRMRVLSSSALSRGDASAAVLGCALEGLAGQVVEAAGARPGRAVTIRVSFVL